MRKKEAVLIVLSIFSLGLNLLFSSGMNPWPVITLSLLAMLYLFFSFAILNNIDLKRIFKKEPYVEVSKTKIAGAILIGLALSLTLIGILFRFKYWPNSSFILETGLGGLLLVTIIGFIKYPRTESDYFINIFRRIVIVGGLGLLFMVVPQNTWVAIKYRNHPQCSDALKKLLVNPYKTELWEDLEFERKSMEYTCTQKNISTTRKIENGDTIRSSILHDNPSIVHIKQFNSNKLIEQQFIIDPHGDTTFDPQLFYCNDYSRLFAFLPLLSHWKKNFVYKDANLLLYHYETNPNVPFDTVFYGQIRNESIISLEKKDTHNLISRIHTKDNETGISEVYFSRISDPTLK